MNPSQQMGSQQAFQPQQGYPPQQQQGYPPQQQQQAVMYNQQPGMGGQPMMMAYPPQTQVIAIPQSDDNLPTQASGFQYTARIKCPSCQKSVSTNVENINGCAVLSWAVCLLFFTGCCCWIPFVKDSCKDKQHRCPNCQTEVGYFKQSFC